MVEDIETAWAGFTSKIAELQREVGTSMSLGSLTEEYTKIMEACKDASKKL